METAIGGALYRSRLLQSATLAEWDGWWLSCHDMGGAYLFHHLFLLLYDEHSKIAHKQKFRHRVKPDYKIFRLYNWFIHDKIYLYLPFSLRNEDNLSAFYARSYWLIHGVHDASFCNYPYDSFSLDKLLQREG